MNIKFKQNLSKRVFLILAAALLSTGGAEVVYAQTGELEEVIVTAQKREQNLQDVPIAITAYSGEQLKELGVVSTGDLVDHTPGLTMFAPLGEGNTPNFSLRGVGSQDITSLTEAPIAVYSDEIYFGTQFGAMSQLYDMERYEVLRGPQGTLFGRNASGGLLHFITSKPNFDEEGITGHVEATFGSYDEITTEGALNIRLNENWAVRLSGANEKYDPYVENRIGGDLSDTDKYAGRFQLAYEGDKLRFTGNYHTAEDDSKVGAWQLSGSEVHDAGGNVVTSATDPVTGENAVDARGQTLFFDPADPNIADPLNPLAPATQVQAVNTVLRPKNPVDFGLLFGSYIDSDNDPWAVDYDLVGGLNLKSSGGWARLEYDLNDNMTLISITGYEEFEQSYLEDTDLSPANDIIAYFAGRNEQISQEIRLEGSTDKINYVGGFFYYDRDVIGDAFAVALPDLAAVVLGFSPPQFSRDDANAESWAIFGQADYALSDQWTFTGGLRYTDESQTLNNHSGRVDFCAFSSDPGTCTSSVGVAFGGAPMGALGITHDLNAFITADPSPTNTIHGSYSTTIVETSDNFITGKAEISYRPNDDLMAYFSYSIGSKSGGFNTNPAALSVPGVQLVYGREELTSYEGGIRSEFLNNSLRANVSVFYYDYADYHAVQAIVPTVVATTNNDATISGLDFEIFAAPLSLPGLTIFVGGAILFDTELENIRDTLDNTRNRELSRAPDYQFNATAQYAWVAFGGEMAVRMNTSYSGEYYSTITNFDAGKVEAFDVWGAGASWRSGDEKLYLALQVENLFESENIQSIFDFSAGSNYAQVAYGRPRWISGTVRFSF
ncbi:MAG: TonB-dependent receptor [Pseudomonadota bacterium]|nr:TonB-dependent receptor [Pseudomonadota bacterium]